MYDSHHIYAITATSFYLIRISWITCGYVEGSKEKSLELRKEGTGGMPEFIENLPEDDIIWGAFKVVGVDDRGKSLSYSVIYNNI